MLSGNACGLANDEYAVVSTTFPADSTGSVYLSFLVNISAVQTGDYFIALSASYSQTNYYARVFVKAVTGGYNIGLSKSNETPQVYGSTVLPLNTTNLVIVKYTFNPTTTPADTNNDAVSLWAFTNGAMPLTEPATGEVINLYNYL